MLSSHYSNHPLLKFVFSFLVIFACILPTSEAQFFKRKAHQIAEAFDTKPKVLFGFDSRNSFIANEPINLFGIKAGVDFNNRMRFGAAFHGTLFGHLKRQVITTLNDTINAELRFGYISLFGEWVWFKDKRWEFSLPMHHGFGGAHVKGIENGKTSFRSMIVFEVSVMGHFKIFPWIGLGAGLGYRQIFIPNNNLREDFSSPVYIFKVMLFTGYIYKYFKEKIRKRKEKKRLMNDEQ